MELCRDQPFHGLVHEVGQINESVSLLNMKVSRLINLIAIYFQMARNPIFNIYPVLGSNSFLDENLNDYV